MFLLRDKEGKKVLSVFLCSSFLKLRKFNTRLVICLVDQGQLEFLFLTVRLVVCMHRLPRGVVESLSLEMLETELDKTLL